MIVKIIKTKEYENKEIKNEIISCSETQFIYCNEFKISDGMLFANKECIQASDYKQYDPIGNNFYEYRINSIYVMNDKGETIERLV